MSLFPTELTQPRLGPTTSTIRHPLETSLLFLLPALPRYYHSILPAIYRPLSTTLPPNTMFSTIFIIATIPPAAATSSSHSWLIKRQNESWFPYKYRIPSSKLLAASFPRLRCTISDRLIFRESKQFRLYQRNDLVSYIFFLPSRFKVDWTELSSVGHCIHIVFIQLNKNQNQ